MRPSLVPILRRGFPATLKADFLLGGAVLPYWLTWSRPSLATMFDYTGKLTYCPNNLLTYSNTFSNGAWTASNATVGGPVADPFGGTLAATLTATGSSAYIYQAPTSNIKNHIAAIWIKRRTGTGTITLYSPDNTTPNTVSITSSWQQFSASGVGAASNAYLHVGIATSGDAIDIYGATLSAVTYETAARSGDQIITTSAAYYGPCIEYDPVTLLPKGLAIWEARTNLIKYSQDVTNAAWTKTASGLTSVALSTTSPDGSSLWNLATEDTGNSQHFFYGTNISLSSATLYCTSAYVKAGSQRYVCLRGEAYATGPTLYPWINFDTTNKTIAANAGVTNSGVIDLGGGVFRVWFTWTPFAAFVSNGNIVFAGSNVGTAPATSSVVGATYVGTSQTWSIWGAQVEAGAFPTPYIPTAASAVARSADIVQLTGSANSIGIAASASIIIEWLINQQSGDPALLGSDGSASDIDIVSTTGQRTWNGSRNLSATNSCVVGVANRSALTGTTNNTSLVGNGGTVVSDANRRWAANATVTYLGSNITSTQLLNGWIRSLALYNSRLPDAILQRKSVVGAEL